MARILNDEYIFSILILDQNCYKIRKDDYFIVYKGLVIIFMIYVILYFGFVEGIK